MIANFFNKTKPITIFNLVVLLFVYYVLSLFILTLEPISFFFFIKKIGFFVWLMLFLLIVSFIIKKNSLTVDNSYALLLIVFMFGIFNQAMFEKSLVFTNFILLLSFRKIYSLRSGISTNKKLFDAGFWIAIATLIYLWSIFYIILVYIAMIIYEKLSLKNLVIPLIGFITPILLFFTYNLYFDNLVFFNSRFMYELNLVFTAYNNFKLLIPISIIIAIIIWSVVNLTPKIVLVSNKFKLSWNVLINHLLIAILIVVLAPTKNGSELVFVFFPAAIIIANFLQKSKSKNFKNMVLYLFLFISIGVYFL
jgi:hypothetical protein